MPCSDGGPSHSDELRSEINTLTQHLCYLLTRITRGDNPETLLPDNILLLAWWNRHQRVDQIRREEEAKHAHRAEVRSAALSKLTLAERAALGLNDDL